MFYHVKYAIICSTMKGMQLYVLPWKVCNHIVLPCKELLSYVLPCKHATSFELRLWSSVEANPFPHSSPDEQKVMIKVLNDDNLPLFEVNCVGRGNSPHTNPTLRERKKINHEAMKESLFDFCPSFSFYDKPVINRQW